jgi:hypothetical protein
MTTLRLMTWNVQNLFEPGTADGPDTPAEFDAKIAPLAAVINGFGPHVLCLQEVGSETARSRRSRPHSTRRCRTGCSGCPTPAESASRCCLGGHCGTGWR